MTDSEKIEEQAARLFPHTPPSEPNDFYVWPYCYTPMKELPED